MQTLRKDKSTMIPQSATSINDYKRCPYLFYLRHVLRLRPIEDAESLRQGTNWHKCLQLLKMIPGDRCPECISPDGTMGPTDTCPICQGSGKVPDDLRMALIRHMNHVYAHCPSSVELTKWEIERTILLYSAIGWDWYWQNDEIETIACEVSFKRQINSVYSRRGKIDKIIRWSKHLLLEEHKSTSKPIDSGSVYWNHLRLDGQTTLYLIEARHAQLAGWLEEYGISADAPLITGMLYDVWKKPLIKPKKLSQADSKKFLTDNKYFDEQFDVVLRYPDMDKQKPEITINGTSVEVTLGTEPKPTKKNPEPSRPFAIRETPEMFGARLLADIRDNPEKHFARQEIARTDAELEQLDAEYYNIARLTDISLKRGLWFKNEHSCDATFRCPFHVICFHNIDVSEGQVPEGFKCLKDKKDG